MKVINNDEDSTPVEVKIKNKLLSSPREIAEEYHKFHLQKMKKIREKIESQNFAAFNIFRKVNPKVKEDLELAPVHISEVRKIMKRMKNSNAQGNTEITNWFIKTIPQFMSIALTHLANQIFSTGLFPQVLKSSRMIQLKKAGKVRGASQVIWTNNNQNPIEKILEELIRSRINNHLQSHKVIPPNHHGCCKGYSTPSAVQEPENFLKRSKTKGKLLIILSTDLSNAFNVLDRSILLKKLKHIGFCGKSHTLATSYLEGRKSFCEVQGCFRNLT